MLPYFLFCAHGILILLPTYLASGAVLFAAKGNLITVVITVGEEVWSNQEISLRREAPEKFFIQEILNKKILLKVPCPFFFAKYRTRGTFSDIP